MLPDCKGKDSNCGEDEFCFFSGISLNGDMIFGCVKKLADGMNCKADSWCIYPDCVKRMYAKWETTGGYGSHNGQGICMPERRVLTLQISIFMFLMIHISIGRGRKVDEPCRLCKHCESGMCAMGRCISKEEQEWEYYDEECESESDIIRG